MKTNHRRSFIDPGSFRDRSFDLPIGNDFVCGKHGHARAVAGFKKARRTLERRRGKENAVLDQDQLDLKFRPRALSTRLHRTRK